MRTLVLHKLNVTLTLTGNSFGDQIISMSRNGTEIASTYNPEGEHQDTKGLTQWAKDMLDIKSKHREAL